MSTVNRPLVGLLVTVGHRIALAIPVLNLLTNAPKPFLHMYTLNLNVIRGRMVKTRGRMVKTRGRMVKTRGRMVKTRGRMVAGQNSQWSKLVVEWSKLVVEWSKLVVEWSPSGLLIAFRAHGLL